MRLVRLFFLSVSMALLGASARADVDASVVKLRAVDRDGTVNFGSAVVIGADTLATTCHVTREAVRLEVLQGERRWAAETQAGSLDHDVCIIGVRGLDLPAAPLRASTDLRLGERVTAAGFQGGGDRLVVGTGSVEGLYPHDGAQVIRTSAPFDFGSSGGGLFDEAGNLVGLLAFKSRNNAALRFALPLEWTRPDSPVAARFAGIAPGSPVPAFWARPKASQPAYLGVASREAAQR